MDGSLIKVSDIRNSEGTFAIGHNSHVVFSQLVEDISQNLPASKNNNNYKCKVITALIIHANKPICWNICGKQTQKGCE